MSTIQFTCNGTFFNLAMPPHGKVHEWINGVRRDDAVNVHPRMFAYLRTTTIEDTVRINITPLVYRVDDEFRTFAGDKINLTDYIPLTVNKAKLILVGLNTETNDVEIIQGAEGSSSSESPLQIPSGMEDTFIPSALIRLQYGDTVLAEDRITDARIFLTANVSGSSVSNATETVAGIIELATLAEVVTGTDDARAVTPLKLKSRLDTIDVTKVTQLINPAGDILPAWSVDNSGNLLNDGGGKLDLQGTPEALVLDADGDTTIDSFADDTVSITASGGVVTTITPSGISLPNGGDISIISSGDIFITDNESGLFRRNNFGITKSGVEDDFDTSSLDAAWAWAGGSFVTPSSVSFGTASNISFGHNVANQRMFLYRTNNITTLNHAIVLSANGFTTDGAYVGWRFDDASDNNYVEGVIRKTTGVMTLEFISRVRTGGGAVTETVRQTIYDFPNVWVIGSQPQGTQWTNWSNTIYLAYPNNPTTSAFYTSATGLTWTPTRRGIVFFNANTTQTFRGPYVDRALRFT